MTTAPGRVTARAMDPETVRETNGTTTDPAMTTDRATVPAEETQVTAVTMTVPAEETQATEVMTTDPAMTTDRAAPEMTVQAKGIQTPAEPESHSFTTSSE